MRGRLFQSADEETEPRGGEAPRLRSHSELVSEPAQGLASCSNPHLPRPSSAPATPSSCPFAASSHRASALPGPSWLCSHSPCCLCLLQGPLPRRLCAGPRAPSACEMRPWQVGSGGNSAPDSQWGEALNHSALGTPPGSDSDSAGRAPRPVPVAKVRDGGPCLPRSPTSVSPPPPDPPRPLQLHPLPLHSLWIHHLLGEGASLLFPVSPHKPCLPLPWSLWPSSCFVPR